MNHNTFLNDHSDNGVKGNRERGLQEAAGTKETNEIVKVGDGDLDCGRSRRSNEEPSYILWVCCGIRGHKFH